MAIVSKLFVDKNISICDSNSLPLRMFWSLLQGIGVLKGGKWDEERELSLLTTVLRAGSASEWIPSRPGAEIYLDQACDSGLGQRF